MKKNVCFSYAPAERHAAMTRAQRLKRVFDIDIEICGHRGGAVKIIASIEDPTVIKSILAHLEKTSSRTSATPDLPPAAADTTAPGGLGPSPQPLGPRMPSRFMTPADDDLSCRLQSKAENTPNIDTD